MQFALPKDERFPLVKVIVGMPNAEPLVMVMDESHRSIEIPDEATYADAYVCDGHACSTEPPIVLVVRKPESEPEPAPKYAMRPRSKHALMPELTILPESPAITETQSEE